MSKRRRADNGRLTGTAKEITEAARRFTRVGGTVHITGHNHLLWENDEGATVLTGKTMHPSRLRHVVSQIDMMTREMMKRNGRSDEPETETEQGQENDQENDQENEMTPDSIKRRLALLDWLAQHMQSKESVPLNELVDDAMAAGHLRTVIRQVTSDAGKKGPLGNSIPLSGAGPWYFTYNSKQAEAYRDSLGRGLVRRQARRGRGAEPARWPDRVTAGPASVPETQDLFPSSPRENEVSPAYSVNQGSMITPMLEVLWSTDRMTAPELRIKVARAMNLPGNAEDYATWKHNRDFSSKLGFVLTDLKNAGCVTRSSEGMWQVTDTGAELSTQHETIKRSMLLNMAKARTGPPPTQIQDLEQIEIEEKLEELGDLRDPAPVRGTQNSGETTESRVVDRPQAGHDAEAKLQAVADLLGLVPGGETEKLLEQLIQHETRITELTKELDAARARESEARTALDMLRQVFGG